MPREPVLSREAPPPSGGYSQAIRAGDFLFCSGQGPFSPDCTRVGETVAEQVRQVLANLDAVASAAGGSLANAVRVGMYISDMRHFDEMDAAYVDAHTFVVHYLAEIDGRIHDLPAPESDRLAWKHVGVMNKVKRDLRAIVTFLAGNDEQED